MTTDKQIEFYQTADGQTEIEVRLEDETVWLNRQQLADLFGRDVKTVGKHINNVFREGELHRDSVVANFATTATDGKTYQVENYSLDVIISVGYRVKSLQGTQFRIWATQRLKELLVQGYTLNRDRFEKNAAELEQALSLIQKAAKSPELTGSSGRGLVDIVSRYTQTFLWLQRYDEGLLDEPAGSPGGQLPTEDEAMDSLASLKKQSSLPEYAKAAFRLFLATWIRPYLVNPRIPPLKAKPLTCSILSSRTIRLPMATNAAVPSCLWTFSTATAACWIKTTSPSSTIPGWQR